LRPYLFLFIAASILLGCGARRGPLAIDADAPTEFTTTESGLKYRILRKSSGDKPSPSDTVTVDYSGKLDDGSVFDSSYNRNQPTTFRLDGVIPGWTEGLQYVGEGGMIELEIPAILGYAGQSLPGIPPNSTLHFKVELHEIK
jgi:FKBP-type peptidyl-prolyl cis-trans isomerase